MRSGAAVRMEEVRASTGTGGSRQEGGVMAFLDGARAREAEALMVEMTQEAERYERLARRVGAVVYSVKARQQSGWRCGRRFG